VTLRLKAAWALGRPEMSTPTSPADEALKKLREELEKGFKEAEEIAKKAQESYRALEGLSKDLAKLAEELKKPPATASARR
jgi:hypothetical protein